MAAPHNSENVQLEIDSLFEKHLPAQPKRADTVYDTIVAQVGAEFAGGTEEQKSRKQERAEIDVKIKALSKDLKKQRNLRNHRKAAENERRAKKRKRIKALIQALKLRLEDIVSEEGVTEKKKT